MRNLYKCNDCGQPCHDVYDNLSQLPAFVRELDIFSCQDCHTFFVMLDSPSGQPIRQDLATGIYQLNKVTPSIERYE